ncbi:MAG: hypothetical protein ACYDCK_10850 [Thermoplasmatota archaeon]
MRPARADLVVCATACVGLALLAGLGAALAPRDVALADAAAHEGERVAVEGRVVALARGAGPATIADATGRLAVFAPPARSTSSRVALALGDETRAIGVVSNGLNGLALAAERLDVLVPAPGRTLTPRDLALDPTRYAGTPVSVRGTLARTGGEWRLADADAPGASVAVAPVAGADALAADERGVATGTFAFDASSLEYALALSAWSADVG